MTDCLTRLLVTFDHSLGAEKLGRPGVERIVALDDFRRALRTSGDGGGHEENSLLSACVSRGAVSFDKFRTSHARWNARMRSDVESAASVPGAISAPATVPPTRVSKPTPHDPNTNTPTSSNRMPTQPVPASPSPALPEHPISASAADSSVVGNPASAPPAVATPAPPPPPPPSGSGGPPPPPPPPAPPPPGAAGPGSMKGSSIQANKLYLDAGASKNLCEIPGTDVKMRGIAWTKLKPNEVRGTVWVREEMGNLCVGGVLEPQTLESLFATNVPEATKEEESKFKVVKKILLLDMKRSNAIGILLSKYERPFSSIRQFLLGVCLDDLPSDFVSGLAKLAPTKDEIEAIRNFDGDIQMLGKSEQFVLEISKIPRVSNRLPCLAFHIEAPTLLRELQQDNQSVIDACETIFNSTSFVSILEVTVTVGNYVNHGSYRGNAYGVRISYLKLLRETKSKDGSTTLLHYLVKFIRTHFPHLAGWYHEFANVTIAKKVDIAELRTRMSQLQSGIESVEREVANEKEAREAGDPRLESDLFEEKMSLFVNWCRGEFSQMQRLSSRLHLCMEDLCSLFAEPVSPTSFVSIITVLAEFSVQFQRVVEEQLQAERRKLSAMAKKHKKLALEALSFQRTANAKHVSDISGLGSSSATSEAATTRNTDDIDVVGATPAESPADRPRQRFSYTQQSRSRPVVGRAGRAMRTRDSGDSTDSADKGGAASSGVSRASPSGGISAAPSPSHVVARKSARLKPWMR